MAKTMNCASGHRHRGEEFGRTEREALLVERCIGVARWVEGGIAV